MCYIYIIYLYIIYIYIYILYVLYIYTLLSVNAMYHILFIPKYTVYPKVH